MNILELKKAQKYANKKSRANPSIELGAVVDEDRQEIDFSRLVSYPTSRKLQVYPNGTNIMRVSVPCGVDGYIQYTVEPDAIDGLIRLRKGGVQGVLATPELLGAKNYDSKTGSWVTSSPPTYYTTEVNATFTTIFPGTRCDFVFRADNRGGVWRFVVDGDEGNYVDISTYSETTVTPKVSTVFSGLSDGNHFLVATFIGEESDKTYTEPARGWVWYDEAHETNRVIRYYTELGVVDEIYADVSNKEFALQCRPAESVEDTQWVPSHGVSGVTEIIEQTIYIDGTPNNVWDYRVMSADNVTVEQVCKGLHPSEPANELFVYTLVTSFSKDGVSIRGLVDFKRDTYIGQGYGCMLPVVNGFAKNLATGKGERIDTTLTTDNTYLVDVAQSVAFFDPTKDYVTTMTIKNMTNSVRLGLGGTPNNPMRVNHRADLQKFYALAYSQHTVFAGTTFAFGANFHTNQVENANSKLPQ